jgi:hypothetical protein
VVEGAGEVVVVVGVEIQPAATVLPRRTRNTLSVSIARTTNTIQIGVQRRRRAMKLITRGWRMWNR